MQADKVSMEYLLREKLEKLVQSEIDGRLRSSGSAGGLPASGSGDARSTAAAMIASLSSSSLSSVAGEGAGNSTVPPPPNQSVDDATQKRLALMQRDLQAKDRELRSALQHLQQQTPVSNAPGGDTATVSRLRLENNELKEKLRTSASSSGASKSEIQSATRTLQAQLDRKNVELEAMRERAVSLERLGARATRIQGRCQALVKERKAVQVRDTFAKRRRCLAPQQSC